MEYSLIKFLILSNALIVWEIAKQTIKSKLELHIHSTCWSLFSVNLEGISIPYGSSDNFQLAERRLFLAYIESNST